LHEERGGGGERGGEKGEGENPKQKLDYSTKK